MCPCGLVRSGDFRNGTPLTAGHVFGNPVAGPNEPFGNNEPQANPRMNGNPVTWDPSSSHFGNQVSFLLQTVPPIAIVAPGTTGTVDVNLTNLLGTNSAELTYFGEPVGVTLSFSPNPDTSSSTVTVTVPSDVPAGKYTITIVGTVDSPNIEYVQLNLVVAAGQAPPPFNPLANVTSMNAYGDSITAGYQVGGSGGTTNDNYALITWANLFSQALLGESLTNNYGLNGSGFWSTGGFMQPAYLNSGSLHVGSICVPGANYVGVGLTVAEVPQYINCCTAFAVWLGLLPANIMDAASFTKSGTFTAYTFPGVGGPTGYYSSHAGDTMTTTVLGTTVYVAGPFSVSGNFTTAFSVTIDGVSQGSFTFSNTMPGSAGDTSPYCLRFSGLASGSHTVVITAISGGVSVVQWIAGNGSQTLETSPFVGLGATIPNTSTGNNTVIAAMNSALNTLCSELQDDGLNVQYIDDNSTLTLGSTDYQSDNEHPNQAGWQLMAEAWESEFNVPTPTLSTPTFSPPAGTYGSAQTVSISCPGASAIYYTLDGSTPTTSSTLYLAPLSVAATTTVKAIGSFNGVQQSSVGTAVYTIT
jgi:lysophospholipase L1-like esterase